PTGTVEVHNVAGSVRVEGWSRNEVSVTGTLGRGAERVEVEGSGSRTVVRVVLRRSSNSGGTDIVVRVPERKSVEVHTVSADVTASGVEGAVSAESVSGEVRVSGRPRSVEVQTRSGTAVVDATTDRVEAQTVSGDLTVTGTVRERVDAEGVSGDVRVTAATGDVHAASVSGNVVVTSMQGRAEVSSVSGDVSVSGRRLSGSFQTVSGTVIVSGDLARDGATEINTHSGSVELRVGSGSSAEIDFTTFSGDVVSQLSGARVTRQSRREQRIVVGRGEARVTVSTFSGDLKLTGR
ncbi:MAG TPA: DUF4097 family beta strand repeat-containing protein, partial [Longimicrobium sp.]|nr:DUF4097 family beta strand repeat-containing protein [Longimicrobium sp.]